ncbi:MAG: hypothetical protein QMD10_07150 [Desulfitobacteriaceae bacterium]|nr:hypothetical protein [Desulfitobacteriaceae bacterium]
MVAENDTGREAHSRPPTDEDVKKICRALNKKGAEYLIIGGLAMNFHGLTRMTHDIDLLIDPSPENIKKVIDALYPTSSKKRPLGLCTNT